MPLVARSSRCSALDRSARIPPWIFGCRVLTRPPSISGEPVTSATSRWAMPASLQLGRRVPAGDQLPAEVRQTLGQLDQPLLVVDGQQGSHDLISSHCSLSRSSDGPAIEYHRPAASSAEGPGHSGRVQPPLDHLDPLVQRLLGVAGQDRDRLLGQDRPGVHFDVARCTVQPVSRHPGRQRVPHPVPAGERRQQGRVGVQDPVGKGPVDGLRHDGPEAGHGHKVDLVRHQRGRHRGCEALAVEVRAEAAVGGPVDQFGATRSAQPGRGRRRAGRTGRRRPGETASTMARRIVPEPETRTARRMPSI